MATVEPGPGAQPFDADLSARLAQAVAARREFRTHHLREDGSPRWTNRLALETSPYLLQHAHNPVDWHPWGEEAFARAKKLDRPIFLSVGYSTCHWCHVMEEESFESPDIAELLNEHFIPVKVDREERPDVDAIYMQAVQMLTRQGGWPMSVFLTPEGKPFFGGTYFPARDGDRGARMGFKSILLELSRVYREERERAAKSAEQIAQAVKQSLAADQPSGLPGVHVLQGAMSYYAEVFDPREGGVRRAPKFPSSMNVRFLLRYWKRTGDEQALRMAVLTLEKMALGGMYDQVGGGFHRYSTDAHWLVPHFEKMLYDNALLAFAYLEGWQATGSAFFRRIVSEVLDYVAREMTDATGAFFSATDADSEGEEGTFFVWTPAQLREVLGEDAARAAQVFQVTEEGNFEGKNVLSLARVPDESDQAFLDKIRPKLYAARARRPPPSTDTKILTSWNGLMISAFARAGLALSRQDYLDRAARAADTVLERHFADGNLRRTGRHAGLLEDHAFLAAGLVDLFEATGEPRRLQTAVRLHEALARRFADPAGGFYRTPADHEALLAREKPAYDGAEPTGNSVAALTLLRLEAITSESTYREQAEKLLSSFGALLAGAPAALGEMLLAVDFFLGEAREVVLVRPRGSSDALLLDLLRPRFAPSQVLIRHEDGAPPATPLARDRPAQGGRTTAYVCVRGACKLPVTEPADLENLL
ncbi:MAG: thioredoxin domain-containing protein [Deltaproteobacteria bacterium]|nr:MAG: thioredoxin domain-containing protein [Deltaproteobacteria bacterium]